MWIAFFYLKSFRRLVRRDAGADRKTDRQDQYSYYIVSLAEILVHLRRGHESVIGSRVGSRDNKGVRVFQLKLKKI